ncbi:MAG TPA: aquaporin [Solirubrobacterales bacterium]|nr:aquaporin [Solirubrobacterales bacterium]
MQDRGLASYIAELIGTLLLTFFITSVVVLYVATGPNATFGSDWAVVGLTHAFVLFVLIASIGIASGGHFNPAVTTAFIVLRRIDPIDGLVYILAQLSGGVLGALLTKGLLLDEGRATNYGTPAISDLLGGALPGAIVEGVGTFVLVLTVIAVALNPSARKHWAPLSIGAALGFLVMVGGPLTGGSFNPARWFGPALVGNDFADAWVYVIAPIVGSALAALVYRFVIEPASGPAQELADEVAPRGPAPPAGEAPPLRQEHDRPGGNPPPSNPPGGIVGG